MKSLKTNPAELQKRLSTQSAIAVIVPIYKAPECVQNLIQSILAHCPPGDARSFIFIDDGSGNAEIDRLLEQDYPGRPDFFMFKKEQNSGFIHTVNLGIELAAGLSDIVILNSDTRIFDDAFTKLQDQAYASKDVASVTPLSNNATIASILGWPDGVDIAPVAPELFARTIHELNFRDYATSLPTGVGFCMFLRRDAVNAVGGFSPDFGRGYGEECDWCRRASKMSFKHALATHSFVLHEGSKSFSVSTRNELVLKNAKLLNQRHPEYPSEVNKYIQEDPHAPLRCWIILQTLLRESNQSVIHVLHRDPRARNTGGTEKHVRDLTNLLADEKCLTVEIFPHINRTLRARILWGKKPLCTETLTAEETAELLKSFGESFNAVHIHHTKNLPDVVIQALRAVSAFKVFTIHDFYTLCPSVNLLTKKANGKERYCGVEQDPHACNSCLKNSHGYGYAMENYRRASLDLLQTCAVLIAPSRNAAKVFSRAGFPPQLLNRVEVIEHHVNTRAGAPRNPRLKQGLKIAFIGAIGDHKGADFVIDFSIALRKLGFDAVVLGSLDSRHRTPPLQLRVLKYSSNSELATLFEKEQPNFVFFTSIWPETFCYTFFEAIVLSSAIPVSFNLGNVSDFITETSCGLVLEIDTPFDEIIKKLNETLSSQEKFASAQSRARLKIESSNEKFIAEMRRLYSTRSAAPLFFAKGKPATRSQLAVEAGDDLIQSIPYKLAVLTTEFLLKYPRLRSTIKITAGWLLRKLRARPRQSYDSAGPSDGDSVA